MHQTWALGLSHYLALADNFSFHLVMEKGTNIQLVFAPGQYYQLWFITFLSPFHGQGAPTKQVHTHMECTYSVGWTCHYFELLYFEYVIYKQGVRVCFHWVAVTTTSFFLKGFCGWESHVQVPQEALFSLGTRVERPSPL